MAQKIKDLYLYLRICIFELVLFYICICAQGGRVGAVGGIETGAEAETVQNHCSCSGVEHDLDLKFGFTLSFSGLYFSLYDVMHAMIIL